MFVSQPLEPSQSRRMVAYWASPSPFVTRICRPCFHLSGTACETDREEPQGRDVALTFLALGSCVLVVDTCGFPKD